MGPSRSWASVDDSQGYPFLRHHIIIIIIIIIAGDAGCAADRQSAGRGTKPFLSKCTGSQPG